MSHDRQPAPRARALRSHPSDLARDPKAAAPHRIAAVGAAFAFALAAIGACSSDANGLFGEAGGTGSSTSGAGGATGSSTSTSSSTSASTSSSTSSGMSSSSASSSSGAGGAGTGGAGTGGAGPICGDKICNGAETPDTCLMDCPTVCGDGNCNGAETSQNCPADCGAPMCAHGVCTAGDKLDMGCDPCVDTVCAANPQCCTNGWDGQCVSQATALCNAGCCGDGQCSGEDCNSCPQDCGTCPPPPTCPHPVCNTGGALNTNDCYDPCVKQTCAASQTCCQGSPPAWTGECVALAKMTCGADPCVTAVCAQNASCCTAGWTQACVDLAKSACNVSCQCAHSICMAGGGPLDSACDPCAAQICAADPYCCNQDWDGLCVGEVASICGAICP